MSNRDSLHDDTPERWYQGITRYQWLVLTVASLGWVFDVFEGQIFVSSMREAMPSLFPLGTNTGTIDLYNNVALASFLLGGALGGVVFGMLSDRIGRTRTMILTILMYSLFTCVTAAAQTPWQMIVLRFLVAMGVGGEWAVASAMVAEVFPARARAWSLSIFHASSVFGTYLAIAAGQWIVNNPDLGWRFGFAVGAVPALLTLVIRWRMREPQRWVEARRRADLHEAASSTGRLSELFGRTLRRRTLVGVSLAAVGLATFWGVHIYGKNLMLEAARRAEVPLPTSDTQASMDVEASAATTSPTDTRTAPDSKAAPESEIAESAEAGTSETDDASEEADSNEPEPSHAQLARTHRLKTAEMIGMFLVTTGGGLGLVMFGPLCEAVGRRMAFALFHLGGLIVAGIAFQPMVQFSQAELWFLLPVFGFLTLGMHAGYAVYFPELFPTRLRSTGAGFCFNVGRIVAAPILVITGVLHSGIDRELLGWHVRLEPWSLNQSALLLSLLFLLGLVVLCFAPETRGQELPE
jgi:MFS family permease